MKTSSAEAPEPRRCPECKDAVTRDLKSRGFVRHKNNPNCGFQRGEKDS
jgi:predicted RNA-binding Zn-ribbon protein involved in translation (DUF1610 family)